MWIKVPDSDGKSTKQEPASTAGQVVSGVRSVFRAIWIGFCMLAGAVILGGYVGFQFSNLWLGLAAAVVGAAIGWALGRNVSPLEVFADRL